MGKAGVIAAVVLAFSLGVLLYLYGTCRSQFHSNEGELKQIKKSLSDARSEKESLRYELDTLTDQLEQLSKSKSEALQRAETAEEDVKKANDDMDKLRTTLNTVQEELRVTKENSDELQGNRDRVKGDLTAYISKWKQCQAAKKDVESQMKQRAQECETDVNGLHSEIDSMRDSKMDTERKLNEIEQSLSVCKQQLISRGGSSQQHPADSQQVVPNVDDRSLELLPPVPSVIRTNGSPDSNGLSHPDPRAGDGQNVSLLSERERARERPYDGIVDDQQVPKKSSHS